MPTLPLFNFPADANASHQVRCPGGYEFWRFEARDPQQHLEVAIVFSLGGFLREDYVRRSARFLRRPTRTPPPVPSDYPSVSACVSESGRQTTSRIMLDAGDFEASTQPAFVRFAANSLRWNSDGVCQVEFHDDQMQIKLAFELSENLAHEQTSGPHRIASACSCQVAGSLKLDRRDISFAGTGMHEHRFGTQPIEPHYSNKCRYTFGE